MNGRLRAPVIVYGERSLIPDYETLMLPLLRQLADGQVRVLRDVVGDLATEFQLTDEERAQLLPAAVR